VTTEVISQALSAGVQATFGQGRVWYIKAATSPLTIVAEQSRSGANVRRFINVGAGFKFSAAENDGWTYLRVTSAVSQVIEIIIGDDDVEVSNAVSVTGAVASVEVPASAFSLVNLLTIATANHSDIAANPTRRRITFSNMSTSGGSVMIRDTGGVGNAGIELQPGTSFTLKNTVAIRLRNNSGASADIGVLEES
jgi:hypothetical protein